VRSLFERFPDLLTLSLAAADHAFTQANARPSSATDADRPTAIRTQVETRGRTCEEWLPLWRTLTATCTIRTDLKLRMRRVREASCCGSS
jgi:hypothetical protein